MQTLCFHTDCAFHAALSKCPLLITGFSDDSSLKGHPELKCFVSVKIGQQKRCVFVIEQGDLASVNVLQEP